MHMSASRFLHSTLLTGGLVAFALIPSLAQRAPSPAVAFAYVHGEIVVRVYVNGSGPYRMLVDTDTTPSVVDAALAKRLKLRPLAPPGQGEGEGSGTIQTYPVELDDIAVGTVHQKRLPALAADISGIGKSIGLQIDGVLGTSFLDGRVMQIDYHCGTIRFLPDAILAAYAARFTSTDGVNVSNDMWVGSKRITATFDTGDGGSSVVSRRGIASLGLQAAAAAGVQSTGRGYRGTTHYTKGYLKDVRVGHVPLGRIDTSFIASSTAQYDVNIGNRVLSRYIATFDYQRGLLTLAPPGACR
jgi:Aspartyl protease